MFHIHTLSWSLVLEKKTMEVDALIPSLQLPNSTQQTLLDQVFILGATELYVPLPETDLATPSH